MIDRPDWYEDALRELQDKHDGVESQTFKYQDLQLRVAWWELMEDCGAHRLEAWLASKISYFM